MWPSKYKYDVFISHAVEDKMAIANELCHRLEAAGLKAWYSGKELIVGDSLEKTIHRGLAQSRYGIVVLSPKYLEKNWPMKEFYVLLAKEVEHRKVVLPILFNLTMDDLMDKEISMIDRWSIPAEKGMDFIVSKIMQVVKPEGGRKTTFWEWMEENSYGLKFWTAALVIAALSLCVCYWWWTSFPSHGQITKDIANRITTLQYKVDRQKMLSNTSNGESIDGDQIRETYLTFMNYPSGYRNEYEFDNGFTKVRSLINVEEALKLDISSLSPLNMYSFTNPITQFTSLLTGSSISEANYTFANSRPVTYEILEKERAADGIYLVMVEYEQNIRIVSVNLQFPQEEQGLKRNKVQIMGFFPRERYTFRKEGSDWTLTSVESAD